MQTNRVHRSASRLQAHGVSLVETSVVLALMGIVATAAMPSMAGMIDNRRIEGAAIRLAADVQFARSEAVARNQTVRLSVHAQCYVVHTGATGDCECGSDAGLAQCHGAARVLKSSAWQAAEPVRVQANVTSTAFDPLLGTATPAATLRVIGPQDRAVHHVVNVMGRLRSCSPQGAVPGYRAC